MLNSLISNHRAYDSMTKLCHGREQDNAGWEGIPVYDSSRVEAVFIEVCRGGGLLVSQRMDHGEFRLPAFRCW